MSPYTDKDLNASTDLLYITLKSKQEPFWTNCCVFSLNTQHQPSACCFPTRTPFPLGACPSTWWACAPCMMEQDVAQVSLPRFSSLRTWAFGTWSLKTCRAIPLFFFFKEKHTPKKKKSEELFRHLDPQQFQNPRCISKWNTSSTLKRSGRLQAVRKMHGEEEAPMQTGWKFSKTRNQGAEGSI